MEEENRSNNTIVCVTGGAGYIGSWLVKKLLLKGYTVHATLRDLNDSSKVGLLTALPNAEERLTLFEADIYEPDSFEAAVQKCEYVFHVATPMQHKTSDFKNTTEAAIASVKSILGSCIRTGTVKRFIYTASVLSASPLKEDGTSFKEFIDESCWTPLHHPFSNLEDFTSDYVNSKTLTEKEVLKFNDKEKYGLDVSSLVCGLVAGETLLPYLSASQPVVLSQILGDDTVYYKSLRFIQEVLGSVPLVHIDDVCEAHIFCVENPLLNGRFICAQAYPTIAEIADHYRKTYPDFRVREETMEEQGRKITNCSTRLIDEGFEFKFDMKKMLDETVDCARRLGSLE
ncbi:hypothetical protein ACHQM5_011804 [Ranunculus cassubicifolius]